MQWIFDGQDVGEAGSYPEDVRAYALRACPWCGTLRAESHVFCCELASGALRSTSGSPHPPARPREARNGKPAHDAAARERARFARIDSAEPPVS